MNAATTTREMNDTDKANREDQTLPTGNEYSLEHTCGCVREYIISGTEEEKYDTTRRISSVECPDCFTFNAAAENAAPRCDRCNAKVGRHGAFCPDCQDWIDTGATGEELSMASLTD